MSLFPRHMKGDPALAGQRVELVVDLKTELRNLGICLSVFTFSFILSAFIIYRVVQTRVLGVEMTEQEWVTKYRYNGQHYPVPDRQSVSASASADGSHQSVDSPTKKSDIKIMVSPSSPTSTISSPMSSPTIPPGNTWSRAPVANTAAITTAITSITTTAPASVPTIRPPTIVARNSNMAIQRQRNIRQRQRVRQQVRRRMGVEAVVEEVEEEEREGREGNDDDDNDNDDNDNDNDELDEEEEEEEEEGRAEEKNDAGTKPHSTAITPHPQPLQVADAPVPIKTATDIIGADSAIANVLRS